MRVKTLASASNKKKGHTEPASLVDRLAIAFISGLMALVTGGLVWLAFAGFNWGGMHVLLIPVHFIWWFAGIMAGLGFLLMENLIAETFGTVWRFLKVFLAGI